VEALNLEATYYRITLDRAISAVDAQVQLDACTRSMDPTMCQGIGRTGAGTINRFANQLTNIGGIRTDGLDVSVAYLAPVTPAGQFRLTSAASFLLAYTERIPAAEGFQSVKRAGKEVGDPERAFPRFKSTMILDWVLGPLRASLTGRYIHSVREPCRDLASEVSVPTRTQTTMTSPPTSWRLRCTQTRKWDGPPSSSGTPWTLRSA